MPPPDVFRPGLQTTRVTKRISIVLVDDASQVREGFMERIRGQPGFHILAASAQIEVALQKIQETQPDIVLLSLRPEGDDSLTLAGALHGEVPASRVIILGLQPLQEDVARFVRARVSGFIMANASFDVFLHTIHSVSLGIQVLPVELTRSLFGQLNRQGPRVRPTRMLHRKRLTPRERAVADLIMQGLSDKAIASRLRIALHTVKSHVHQVLSKLAVSSRLEVAAFSESRPSSKVIPRPPLAVPKGRALIPAI